MDYREKIDAYLDKHKKEMVNDIIALCRVNSERSAYVKRMPFGEGPALALRTAMDMGERYGFSIRNYDNFVCTLDLNDGAPQLDILAHLDVPLSITRSPQSMTIDETSLLLYLLL